MLMTQSYLCLPLVDCGDRVRAVVEVFNSRHDVRDVAAWLGDCESDSSLAFRSFKSTSEPLRAFSGFVGALLRAAAPIEAFVDNLNGSSDRTVEPISSIFRRTFDGASGQEEVPLLLLDFLQRALGVEGWTVYAYDRKADTLWARLASDRSRTKVSTVLMGHGVIGRAASTAEPLFDGDVLCVPMFDQCKDHRVNSVVVFYGTQKVKRKARGAFRQSDVELCTVVCRHVGSSCSVWLSKMLRTRRKTRPKRCWSYQTCCSVSLSTPQADGIAAQDRADNCSEVVVSYRRVQRVSEGSTDA